MSEPTLQIEHLKVAFATPRGTVHAVRDVSFSVTAGQTLAIVGESGCGKSVTTQAVLGLLPEPEGRVLGGSARLQGTDLLQLDQAALNRIRGRTVGTVFQDPMSALNPTMRIGDQLVESLRIHQRMGLRACRQRAVELLRRVRIPQPELRARQYPFQFSGGMLQRALIAQALACEPAMLIADEPTTALDVTVQAEILDLLVELQADTGMAILLITHDLGVVARMAHQVAVMYAGEIVESGSVDAIFGNAGHPYTQGLRRATPSNLPGSETRLEPIPGTPPDLLQPPRGCAYAARCPHAMQVCQRLAPSAFRLAEGHDAACWLHHAQAPAQAPTRSASSADATPAAAASGATDAPSAQIADTPLVAVRDLHCHYRVGRQPLKAVNGVSLQIQHGEVVGLVGESGSGKSTLGKAMLGLAPRTAGEVLFRGQALPRRYRSRDFRAQVRSMQMIFQDPYGSLNPRLTAGEIIAEGLRTMTARDASIARWLQQVGLAPEHAQRYPHEFSGGQRQRIGIARALAMEPAFMVCDEPISALDVSVQAQIVMLLSRLRQQFGLTLLFIAHDLSMVRHVADRIAVMYRGQLVEVGPAQAVFFEPLHPYSQLLVGSNPEPDPEHERQRPRPLRREQPQGQEVPDQGCPFADRCPHVMARCHRERPPLAPPAANGDRGTAAHQVACFLFYD